MSSRHHLSSSRLRRFRKQAAEDCALNAIPKSPACQCRVHTRWLSAWLEGRRTQGLSGSDRFHRIASESIYDRAVLRYPLRFVKPGSRCVASDDKRSDFLRSQTICREMSDCPDALDRPYRIRSSRHGKSRPTRVPLGVAQFLPSTIKNAANLSNDRGCRRPSTRRAL